MMNRLKLIFITQFILSLTIAQKKFPALTNIISFDELKKKSVERHVEWKNPDGSEEQLNIIEMAIPFDEGMKKMTHQFVHEVYGLDSIWLTPKMIVFHAMGDGDLKTSLEVSSFLNDRIPESWGNLSKAGPLSNGAHFIIDRDGTVICLFPPVSKKGEVSYSKNNHRWYIKRHQDGNPVAIGIENVTDKGDYTHFTNQQIESNAQLARWLIWFEDEKIKFIASHHQFNEDHDYETFLKSFELQNFRKEFRTKGRKDVGRTNLKTIALFIRNFSVAINLFFIG